MGNLLALHSISSLPHYYYTVLLTMLLTLQTLGTRFRRFEAHIILDRRRQFRPDTKAKLVRETLAPFLSRSDTHACDSPTLV